MKLTKQERLILSNQYRILSAVTRSHYYEKCVQIMEGGYTYLYGELFGLIEDEMPEQDCREVYDILNMYKAITLSYNKLTDEEKKGVSLEDIKFPGFDEKEEIKQFQFASLLMFRTREFWDLEDVLEKGLEGNDKVKIPKVSLNSHSCYLSDYRKMLYQWEVFEWRQKLTRAEIC